MGMNSDLSELLDVDAAISTASPSVQPPAASAVAAGGGVAYDGSSKVDRLAMWRPALRSADADILPEKGSLDARVGDTLRNDAYVSGGADIRKDSIVGSRFTLTSKPETKLLWGKEDKVWETEFQEEVEAKFDLAVESPRKWIDASRHNTLTSFVRMAVGIHLAGGEVLASAEWLRDSGRPFHTAIQMIDTARLETPYENLNLPQNRIRKGVERDRFGAPIAYHIRNSHPNEGRYADFLNVSASQWKRVPAYTAWGRQNILHIFEQLRPDQTRGISAIVTALTEMRMTKHFRKTELERAVVAATYAASIESEIPENVPEALGQAYTGEGNATSQYMTEYLAQIMAYAGGASNLHMDGAKIPIFAPGTHLKIQNPGTNGPVGDKFEQSLLRYIAAALGLSYEQLSRDYTQTNYSSARASMGEAHKSMMALKKAVADAFANFIYRLWLEEVINANQLECLKRANVPSFYEGLNAEAYCACDWVGAGQGQIDPLKETQAAVLKIKNGLSTKEQEIARISGGDYRRVARQIQRERELDEFYGNPSIYNTDSTDMENALAATPSEGTVE